MGQIFTLSAGGIEIPLLESLKMEDEKRKDSILLPTNIENWQKMNIAIAATQTPPPQKFNVGHLPDEAGIYGLLIGPDGSRKSWLALHLAMAKALGKPIAGGLWSAPETSGRVVYITTEDSANVLWRRIFAMAQQPGNEAIKNLDNLDILPLNEVTLISQTPNGPVYQEDIDGLIEYAKGAKLIILDPLADLADAEESDDRAARLLVQALRKISTETGAGVIAVHHQNKNAMLNGGISHQTGRGSSRLGAGCRWAVVLQPLDKNMADKNGISDEDKSRWTVIHEAKSSYTNLDEEKTMYHHKDWLLPDGNLIPGIPLCRDIITGKSGEDITEPKKGNSYSKATGKGVQDDDDFF